MLVIDVAAVVLASVRQLFAYPPQEHYNISHKKFFGNSKFYDIQAHRGGRGNVVENTLPSFAWGLIDGATRLELDNGVTKDGVVVVWHDESIVPTKCQDTAPALPNDPDYPYVGKFIANLTFAQLRTLDCGSQRQSDFPMQLVFPKTRISTMKEVFDFVECADPSHDILWNIESKIDARHPERTVGAKEFARRQLKEFSQSPYKNAITYQSFDWRTLKEMKKLDSEITLSALIDDESASVPEGSKKSPWLAGLRLDAFPGPTLSEQVAQAAHALGAHILSPSAESSHSPTEDPEMDGYVPFTTEEMVREAHRLGLSVKPWSVNNLNAVEQLAQWKVDGIITDYPNVVRRWAKQNDFLVAPKYPKQRVLTCLEGHLKRQNAS